MSIGENIRYLRKKAGLTQKQLAQKVGVNEVTIRSYERKQYEPKTDVLHRLVKALNCNINELLDKPFEIPDFSADDLEEIEGSGGVMIPKNYPQEIKEKIKSQFLLNPISKAGESTECLAPTIPTNTEHNKDIVIDDTIDEKNPFNILQKKIENGESLTKEEVEQYNKHILNSVSSIQDSLQKFGIALKQSLSQYYSVLNEAGQREADTQIEKAIEKVSKQAEAQIRDEAENQIKLLIRIPEYQKDPEE